MMKKRPRVLFNASVILAGLYSPSGASGVLLALVKKRKIDGIISEIIFSEVIRHADKIGKGRLQSEKKIIDIFGEVVSPPGVPSVEKYYDAVTDRGDAHVLACYDEEKCDILVTLDKKHLLVLQGKIKGFQILSPGQLVKILRDRVKSR